MLRIRIRDPVPFDPWIQDRFFPDPGSRIPNPYFEILATIFWGKKFYNSFNSLKINPNYFLQHFKNKSNSKFSEILNFLKFMVTRKSMTTNIFPSLFCCCFWIRDPGSQIRDPGWVKIRIWDKHPESATLNLGIGM